jgi:NitT/TauT family transport system ATP-binding protein
MRSIPALPDATINRLIGLIRAMRETQGTGELSRMAGTLRLELSALLPLLEAAKLLGFAFIKNGRFELTSRGRTFAEANEGRRKALFRESVEPLPLLREILDALGASSTGTVAREAIRQAVRRRGAARHLEHQLDTATDWGRYAELFDYDAEARDFISVRQT